MNAVTLPREEKGEYMTHLEEVKEIRSEKDGVHYNCAQAILMTYADELGMTKEKAKDLGNFFGRGMLHGSSCGALSAAFMILGIQGYDKPEAAKILTEFKKKHSSTECIDLIQEAKRLGIVKREHCDQLIFEMTEVVDQMLKKQK